MRRDFKRIRKLLLRLEAATSGVGTVHREADAFQVRLLQSAGFVDLINVEELNDPQDALLAARLTWSGCNFLELVRDKARFKSVLQALGPSVHSSELINALRELNNGEAIGQYERHLTSASRRAKHRCDAQRFYRQGCSEMDDPMATYTVTSSDLPVPVAEPPRDHTS